MDLDPGYYAQQYYYWLQYCAGVIAVIILISSADDLFIDAYYWIRRAFRALTVKREFKPLKAAQLQEREEQPIAIMIPAWHEYGVIAAMLEDAVRVLDYRNYVIFVGTYVNDPATSAEVERMRMRYKQLHRVEVPHDGPTCKADCLNWVVQAALQHERNADLEFAGFVLHDSEDVLHSLELKFFNFLVPRKDMIQLPVASLERHWYELVAGTYMDEFAEWHAKDLVVRESMTGSVPSAGVGTCFSRRAMLALIETTKNQPFNTDSLTEDYDVGTRLLKLGMESIFAVFPVQFRTRRKSVFGLGDDREVTVTVPLSVREFFPDTVRTAYRQRARWVLGIGMQGWQQTGWSGSLANRYLLFRDRKGVVTSFVGMLAYVLVLQFIAFMGAASFGLTSDFLPSPFVDSTWMKTVLVLNTIAVLLRVMQRVYFVTRLYGWEQGIVSIPRMVVANFINFLAVSRAWRLFASHLITGRRLAWDKTMHDFPSAEGLSEKRRQRLGELLISWQAINEEQLKTAMEDELASEAPLGRVLLARGWLDEETLAEALSFQSELERAALDPALLDEGQAHVPLEHAIRYRVLPQGTDHAGRRILLAASPIADDALKEIERVAGGPVTQRIVRESEIATGFRFLRGAENALEPNETNVPLLGDLLIQMGYITRASFNQALKVYRPEHDGRIGEFMVAYGAISARALSDAVQTQSRAREAGQNT